MPSPDLPIIQAVQKYAGNLNKHFIGGKFVSGVSRDTVSYTHLTLPTKA